MSKKEYIALENFSYSDDHIDKLISIGGNLLRPKDFFKERLKITVAISENENHRAHKLTKDKLRDQMKNIESACNGLIKALDNEDVSLALKGNANVHIQKIGGYASIFPQIEPYRSIILNDKGEHSISYWGGDYIAYTMEAVRILQEIANDLKDKYIKGIEIDRAEGKGPNEGHVVQRKLVKSLCEIWDDFFGHGIHLSTNPVTNERNSKLVSFISAALSPFVVPLPTHESIHQTIKRLKNTTN